jgi:antitoxin YefM
LNNLKQTCTIFLYINRIATMTIETTYSQAREQLKTLMDRAVDDREVIVVRRRVGGDVAMIAADELESLVETAHLLRSTKNAERLLTALTRARTESVKPTPLDDLQKRVGFDA